MRPHCHVVLRRLCCALCVSANSRQNLISAAEQIAAEVGITRTNIQLDFLVAGGCGGSWAIDVAEPD